VRSRISKHYECSSRSSKILPGVPPLNRSLREFKSQEKWRCARVRFSTPDTTDFWRRYAQCTDDPDRTWPGVDTTGEGRLLRSLSDSLDLRRTALRTLRVRANPPSGCHAARAVGPRPGSLHCIGRIAIQLFWKVFHSIRCRRRI
jgi:hypothetical protein